MFTYDLEKFVDREDVLAAITDKVDRLAKGNPFAPEERVIHIVGPSGIGKSYLLEKCYDSFSNNPIYIPILVKLEIFRKELNIVNKVLEAVDKLFSNFHGITHDDRNEKTLNSYGISLIRKINKYASKKVVIFLLDEINIPHKNELQSIEEHFLQKLLHENPKAVIITAGRSPAGLIDFALRPKFENTIILPAFDEKTTGDQVEMLRPGASQLASKIYDLGNGVPAFNKKLIEHAVGDPLTILDDLKAIKSLTVDIKQEISEHFHHVIEAICVFKDFYPDDVVPLLIMHPGLDDKWDEARVKEMFTNLNQVQVGPGKLVYWSKKTWVMDEPMRKLFERELKIRDPKLWKTLHCTAYQTYKKWGEDLKSKEYMDKATYHQQCLQSAGMDCEGLEG